MLFNLGQGGAQFFQWVAMMFRYVWTSLYEKPIFTIGDIGVTVGGILIMGILIDLIFRFIQKE